jgi:putative flippase GtrA
LQIKANLTANNIWKNSFNISFFRWGFVGIFTLLIDSWIFIYLYRQTESVLVSNSISALTALFFNYCSHYIWSFSSKAQHKFSVPKYLLNFISNWVLITVGIKLMIVYGAPASISKIFPTIIFAPISYIVLKYFVYEIKLSSDE